MSDVEITTREEEGVEIITICGDLIQEGEEINKAIGDVQAAQKTNIIVDLRNINYMASAAIGSIAALHKRSSAAQGRLALVRPDGRVGELLRLTRLDQILNTYATMEEALASFKEQ